MKKVLFEQINTINISELNDKSLVGILFKKEKSVIARNSLGFFGFSRNEIDFTGRWYADSLKSYLFKFDNNKEVFVFDSKEEMFKWLNS